MRLAWPAIASSMRVVDHLGEQVVERVAVGAADIHARPAPDRLEPLEHLDVGGRIGRRSRGSGRSGFLLGSGLRAASPNRSSLGIGQITRIVGFF